MAARFIVLALLGLVACASAGNTVVSTHNNEVCSDVPTQFFTAVGNCSDSMEICSTSDGETESTVCSNTIYPPTADGQYLLTLGYASEDCTGPYMEVSGRLVGSCYKVGSYFRTYSCSNGNAVVNICDDSNCSVNCYNVTYVEDECEIMTTFATGAAYSFKYECSSGFHTAAFASVTALLAAVASALSFF